jgi:DNA-binding protein HU-beta
MNKSEMVAIIAFNTKLPPSQVSSVLLSLADAIELALRKGSAVSFGRLGKFSVSKRGARMGRNPRNGLPIRIPAARVPKFYPTKTFKSILN